MVKQVKGALFYSILICTLIGIPLGVTTIPEGFLPISTPHSLAPTFYQFDFSQLFTLDMAVIIFTLLFMDMFDTIGTLVALTYRIGIVKENGEFPVQKRLCWPMPSVPPLEPYWVVLRLPPTWRVLRSWQHRG